MDEEAKRQRVWFNGVPAPHNVEFPPVVKLADLLKVRVVGGVVVTFKPHLKQPVVAHDQCNKCQRPGDVCHECFRPAVCARCGLSHETSQCLLFNSFFPKQEDMVCFNPLALPWEWDQLVSGVVYYQERVVHRRVMGHMVQSSYGTV